MSTSDRSWLPSCSSRNLLRYVLALLLLCNATVLLLLVSGDLSIPGLFAEREDGAVQAEDAEARESMKAVVPVMDRHPAPVNQRPGQRPRPVVSSTDTGAADTPEPVAPVAKTVPKQKSSEILFFGVPLD